ncbi:hypothetical protein KC19_5G145400 [Ceratodon purpureus]|uniref:Protein kinase domain-containing protein n=1 Tax=Ceratodon purpureus TaxID=3225 RepID=A0A8T0I414_CERPU|nr:hypothetical protein KC19_5G145400 [Ceratodon purpureus]
MSKPGRTSESLLDLCKYNVRSIKDRVESGILLNQKQCQDLSSKLSQIISNIEELASYSGASIVSFGPALEKLYRCLEKAKLLVTNCAEEDWCAAAVFQCQNENAFREILLDVGFCYNAIYEQAKTKRKDWNDPPQDLRQGSLFVPATDGDALEDRQDLQRRLDELSNAPTKLEGLDNWIPGRVSRKQSLAKCLANYLLIKMYFTSKEPLANNLDRHSPILWKKGSEPSGTWGNSRLLGSGAGADGVCETTWLGIPCAKKEFHDEKFEDFFLKEAGISARMKHPSVIDFISCGNDSEKGDRFIAMEHMQMNLYNLIEKQKGEHFSVAAAVDMMVQMARGVWYLHGQGVAHRDLKPQNVVVNKLIVPHVEDHYCVKLVDFGVSKTEVEVSKINTMTYRGIGTTMYRAPEAHPKANEETKGIGKVNWFKADAFSFAITCAHLLSLETPFKDTTPNDLFGDLNNGIRPKVPDHVYPQELISILEDCWETDPCSRPSFAKICARLEEFQLKFLMGYATMNKEMKEENIDVGEGIEYIKMKLGTSTKGLLDNEVEDEAIDDHVAIIRCTCNHALELLPQLPSIYTSVFQGCTCNLCWKPIKGNIYHCEICLFDAHSYCAKIKDKVKATIHDHYLHLLVQNDYSDEPDAICCLCEESLQESEWVYRCEECDFDVHAMCAKFRDQLWHGEMHGHTLTLIRCPPRRNLTCTRCSDGIKEYTWRYTCGRKSCALNLHPLCAIHSWNILCIFDTSHRLSLNRQQRTFHCSRCGAPGFSWSYHCFTCDVDIHPDCVDAIYDDRGGWIKDYEKLMMETGSKDNHTMIIMISELLDKVSVNDALEASSSAGSGTPQVTMRVQPSLQRLSLAESPSLDASKDANLQRQISTATKERIKGTKTEANEARQKLRASLLEVLESVERIVLDMQSFETMSQDVAEALAVTHKKLKSRQALVKERMAMQVQSKMGQGPRIALFYQNTWKDGKYIGRKLLTSLQADMEEVCFALLCEEPGHEHILDDKTKIINGELGEETAEKLQALVAPGLQVVRKAMKTLEPHELTALDSVTIPCLEDGPWDLRAIARFEEHGNESSDPVSEDSTEQAESLKRAVDSAAEWFRSGLEDAGFNILKIFGLQRVRYKVREESDDPKYRGGSMAWLCSDHVSSGSKAGTLEAAPNLKYYNVEDDYQLRYPHVNELEE